MTGRCGIAVVCAIVLLLASGCGKEAVETAKVPFVKTQRAGSLAKAGSDIYPGSVRARYESRLSFQVGGQVLSRKVQEGSRVRAGDILMTVDPKDVREQANQGEAQVASAQAQLDLAQANLARYDQLYREHVVPAAVLDQYRMSYDAAEAAYRSAVAQSVRAKNSLGYANLIAPSDGVISAVAAEEGQVVSVGQTVLTLSRTDELEIEINVPENHLSDVPVGRPVMASFWALSGETEGVVREVSPMADAVSRTYRVRVSLPAPPDGMELGMTASVSVTAAPDAGEGFDVPLAAIYQSDDAPQVWVVEHHRAHLQPVRVLAIHKGNATVQGVKEGSLIVVAGVHKLREGQEVRTEEDDL